MVENLKVLEDLQNEDFGVAEEVEEVEEGFDRG